MIITTPCDDDLCVAPELAILGALEVNLAITIAVLNIAHTEILAPGAASPPRSPDSTIAAALIAQSSHMIATINRYRLALVDPDAGLF
ncbi:MAG: hypothetical protein ACRDZ4_13005 [Egibacteraceae bacterium]